VKFVGVFSDYVMWELSIMCTTCTNETLVLQMFCNHISVLVETVSGPL